MPAPPNILLLLTDEQRFDAWNGANAAIRTPQLDALARDGVVFTRAYTSNPSCVPARAALFTGKFPHQCGAPTYITHLPAHETVFPKLLRDAGYRTAYIGKLHFGTSAIDRGLDYQDIIDAHGPRPEAPEANSYNRWLADQGFRQARELIDGRAGPRLYAEWKADSRLHIDNYTGDRGREWIEQTAPADRPWFCCVSFPGPHMPMDCGNFPEARLYPLEQIELPSTTFEMLREKPPHNLRMHGDPPPLYSPLSEYDARLLRQAYFANVTLIDRKIGEIVDALKMRGQYDRTLILFASDHGDYMGDFQLAGKGQNVPEVLMRIPFIAKPPSCQVRGKRESSLVSSVDIAATCLAAAGAEIPGDMASRDLSPYWRGHADRDDRELLYFEAGGIRGLRDRRWKYCYYQGREYGELYDLAADPWETRNLWSDAASEPVKARFQTLLLDKLIELSPWSRIPWNKGAPQI